MRSARWLSLPLLALAVSAAQATAQSAPPDFRAEFEGQFGASARKLVALAEAMPADAYAWRPMEGVASVVEVYMHIARYNYMYPDQNLGIDAPVVYADFEDDITEKARAVETLAASMEHVRTVVAGMSDDDLEAPTRLYGRDVAKWAVLLQLVAHMNEHLGQSIAYARVNGVAPPWSR
jgi:uncharacterized damage-inducible protein DinB